ncbi:Hypothetical protein A7982_00037 [Minicystis rosea]|nr:Hypothetical protein A7982_00037 [Minicystis rosea]
MEVSRVQGAPSSVKNGGNGVAGGPSGTFTRGAAAEHPASTRPTRQEQTTGGATRDM